MTYIIYTCIYIRVRYMFRLPSRSLGILLGLVFHRNVGLCLSWTGNILQTKSTEKNVLEFEIWKLTAECGCTTTYKINQLLGLSGL